jgi:hypothetical protein
LNDVSATNIDTRKVIDVELLITYCQQWKYVKNNEDKFRQRKDTDVWEDNFCGVTGVMAAAGAVAIFAHSVSRLQDYVTRFIGHIWQHDTLRGVMSHMHYDKLSHIL